MKNRLLIILSLIALPWNIYAQLGYEEEMQPSMVKVIGHVRKITTKVYYPVNNADTLGTGVPDEINTYLFDTIGQVTRIDYENVKDKKYPKSVITYKYFGKDSVISSEPRGGNYIHKIKTINKYDERHRLRVRTFYVSQYPVTLKPILFHSSVTNVYDSAGFIVRQLHKAEDGRETVIEFVNDKNGNHIGVKPQDVGKIDDSESTTYQYDENNNPVKTGTWIYRYTYDRQGNWTKLTQYMNMYLNDARTSGFTKLMRRYISYY